jgi:hypothetical protein
MVQERDRWLPVVTQLTNLSILQFYVTFTKKYSNCLSLFVSQSFKNELVGSLSLTSCCVVVLNTHSAETVSKIRYCMTRSAESVLFPS